QPPNREVRTSEILIVVDEVAVDQGATDGADHRHRLGRDFLSNDHAEAFADFADQADQGWSGMVDYFCPGEVLCGPRDLLGHGGSDSKIADFRCVLAGGRSISAGGCSLPCSFG